MIDRSDLPMGIKTGVRSLGMPKKPLKRIFYGPADGSYFAFVVEELSDTEVV
jgi:hypothetical protein